MSTSPKRLAALASVALAVAGVTVLSPPTATANPAGTGLVINEVYGGGGSSTVGASYKTDWVELYNPTAGDISVNGMSLQYRSATYAAGGGVSVAALPNKVVKAGGTFVAEVSGPATTNPQGADLANPDFSSSALNMSQSNGQVVLSSGTTPITALGNLAAVSGVVDMVGYGTTPTSFETARTGSALSISTSTSRTAGADTDSNAVDFAVPSTPSPVPCGATCTPPPPTDPTAATIAEIQGGNVFTSPMVGELVVTEGVVTAAYPAGGFFGFYLQTEGTGGSVDPATRTHSDAIFVRQTAAAGAVTLEPGDFVSVTGTVTEFANQTQIEVTDAADIETLVDTPDPVTATTTTSWPDTNAKKEALEGMLYTPEGNFTISNNFATNQFGELGLARGDSPLIQPTEVARPATPAYTVQVADNAARAIVLDDGASTDFLQAANQSQTPPYISNATPWRTGATGTFSENVILTEGGSPSAPTYRFEPLERVVGPANTETPYTVANTRTNAPDVDAIAADGEPAVKVASFNVLNYFTTLGDANDDNIGDGGCVAFNDRAGDGNSVQTGCDQRGAWDPQDLNRQQTKIVAAINALDADVVGLMEIENSAVLGETADEATQTLVDALNAASAPGTWAVNPSSDDLPAVSEMDVISNAIIYQPAAVERVGDSLALGDQSTGNGTSTDEPFANAREPIGQEFQPVAGGEPFLVVVNHFKSKGSAGPFPGDTDQGDGQGAANQSRIRQAQALRDWIPTIQGDVDDVLLLGDFNSYTKEDPLQELYNAGYQDFETIAGHGKYSYSFSGLSGSLDHVLGNAGAVDRFTGADVWNVNSVESIAMEYSRYNYSGTDFNTSAPFRASDHDPVVIGLTDTGVEPTGPVDIQILGTNDFHGRIKNDSGSAAAGAAAMAGAVKTLRQQNPDTVFAAAGDLIGASTFESFIDKDKPTIDALNEAGLEVSSVGNHEFDQGYDDLVNRVMAAYDANTNPQGGAEWEYIAANLKLKGTNDPTDIAPSWTKTMDGVEVGFVGAVTEHLPELVSPAGIADIDVTDVVTAVNAEADKLEADGADLIVLLVHEGAPTTTCATMDDDPTSDFGSIITGIDDNVDAIISGHTHLEYNCSFPVAGWAGRPVTDRPVVSAGQYGANLNQLVFTVDPTTGEVQAKTQAIIKLKAANGGPYTYPPDPATQAIVDAAVAKADILGAVPLGRLAGPFKRSYRADGTTENRGGESTLGNQVAEVQRWAGGTQIAFMNPGGLREDMVGNNASGYPATVTYKQAANVQPFANTLVRMNVTGAQIKTVLEQQWQTNPGGPAPSRPYLKLGLSKGFTYTYDPDAAQDSHIKQMWLNGVAINPASSYSVTVNSFLAAGGDNFRELNNGSGKADTGVTDLQAMVDYLDEFANPGAGDPALPVDYSQRAVGVDFAGGAPTSYPAGTPVKVQLSSLDMTGPGDVKDSAVTVRFDGAVVGSFPIDHTNLSQPYDEVGVAEVAAFVPLGATTGVHTVTFTGATTGTSTSIPVTTTAKSATTPVDSTISASAGSMAYGTPGTVVATVTPPDAAGTVQVLEGASPIGTGLLVNGVASISVPGTALQPGSHTLTVRYTGETFVRSSETTVTLTVTTGAQVPTVGLTLSTGSAVVNNGTVSATAKVTSSGPAPTGDVAFYVDGVAVATGKLANGTATATLGPLTEVGSSVVEARYLGDNATNPGAATADLKVTKAKPKLKIKVKPGKVVVDETQAKVVVTLNSIGQSVTGWVQVKIDGKVTLKKLKNGKVTVKKKFATKGKHKVVVKYLGDDLNKSVQAKTKIKVVG